MSGGHNDHGGHGHHDHTAGANARALSWALALTLVVLVAEAVGSWAFGSLALLSDAAHMFTDAAALAIALAAIRIGARGADDRRTYGYRRFEILAAAFNAILLFGVGAYVIVEGVARILHPAPVEPVGMLAVAALGLVVNLIAMRLLAAGRDTSLNMRGAYLEVWADMLGSLGVIVGAIAIMLTGLTWIDAVVAIGIGLWVLPRAWSLLKDTTNILLEGVPRGIALAEVRDAIGAVDGVAGVHDLHVWSLSTTDVSATAHVALGAAADPDTVRRAVTRLLADRFAIAHATIQTERDVCRVPEHARR